MRYSTEHKQDTRTRIMGAAARVFREHGFGGAGIDGLTKAAGVTNGAFYGHFTSKAEAFRAAILAGLRDVRAGVAAVRGAHGDAWLPAFARLYLGPLQAIPLGAACVLPTLTSEVMRADAQTRAAFTEALRGVVDEMAAGTPGEDAAAREAAAMSTLALLVGGAMLGRAVSDPELAQRITDAVERRAGEAASN